MTKDSRKPYRRRSSSNNYDRSHKKSYGKKRTNQNKPETPENKEQQEEGIFSRVTRFAKGVYDFGKIVVPAVLAIWQAFSGLSENGYFGSRNTNTNTNHSKGAGHSFDYNNTEDADSDDIYSEREDEDYRCY